MRHLKWLGVAGACLMMNMSFTQPSFELVKRINLSSYFTTDSPNGEWIGDVAFDGTNAYVAGFALSGSDNPDGTRPVGVLKITDVLSNSPGFNNMISLNQAGASRDTKVLHFNGSLYLGTGLGNSLADPNNPNQNDPARTGIRKYDTSGNQDLNWSGDGVLLPSEIEVAAPPRRSETIAIDPGFGTPNDPSDDALGVLNRNRGIIFRRSLLDGSPLPNATVFPGAGTAWRDLSFDPNGNAYFRALNDVFVGQRTGANTFALPLVKIIDLPDVELAQMNVLYLTTPNGDVLVLNDRSPVSANPNVLIYRNIGGVWTLEQQLTGYNTSVQNYTYGTAGGDLYLFVAHSGPSSNENGDINGDGIVDDADLAQVIFDFGATGADLPSDTNGDQTVDDADLATVIFNFGSEQPWRWLDIYRVS